MTTLYHGTYLQIPEPLAKIGRKNLDFGPPKSKYNARKTPTAWGLVIKFQNLRTKKRSKVFFPSRGGELHT